MKKNLFVEFLDGARSNTFCHGSYGKVGFALCLCGVLADAALLAVLHAAQPQILMKKATAEKSGGPFKDIKDGQGK